MKWRSSHNPTVFVAVVVLLCLSACNVRRPRMVMSDRKMAEVLYDYHLAEAMMRDLGVSTDEDRQAYMDFVFQKHGIMEERFDSSLSWFSKNPQNMMNAYEMVYQKYQTNKDDLANKIAERDFLATEPLRGDTVNVWPERSVLRLTGKALERLVSFNVEANEFFENADSIEWSVDYHFINGTPSDDRAAVMMLQVWYDKDSLLYEQRTVKEDGMQVMALRSDTLGAIKNLQGFIYYPRQEDSTKFVLLTNISLLRMHTGKNAPLENDSIVAPKIEKSIERE